MTMISHGGGSMASRGPRGGSKRGDSGLCAGGAAGSPFTWAPKASFRPLLHLKGWGLYQSLKLPGPWRSRLWAVQRRENSSC